MTAPEIVGWIGTQRLTHQSGDRDPTAAAARGKRCSCPGAAHRMQ